MYLYLHLHESIEINWNGFEMVSIYPPLKALLTSQHGATPRARAVHCPPHRANWANGGRLPGINIATNLVQHSIAKFHHLSPFERLVLNFQDQGCKRGYLSDPLTHLFCLAFSEPFRSGQAENRNVARIWSLYVRQIMLARRYTLYRQTPGICFVYINYTLGKSCNYT